MSGSPSFFAIGCLPFQGDSIGFALPIFRTTNKPKGNFVQEIDEYTGKIINFLELEATSERIISYSSDLLANVGGDQIVAFVTEDGLCHIGTPNVLAPILRAFMSRFPDRHSIALQVAELIGDPQEKKRARVAMREEVVKSAGPRSARAYYEGSALRSAVWANLLAGAPNADVAQRILRVRARLGASVNTNGDLRLHLDVLSPSDRALIDEEKLKKAILSEFAVLGAESDSYSPSNANADNIQTGRVRELLARANRAPRQEERIAILIDGILQDKSVGTSALLQYGRDRAKFANRALEEIKRYLTSSDLYGDRLDLTAAKLVGELYGMQFPANRGNFLLYFAKYLAKWPEINHELRLRLERTHSIFVEYLRPTIEEFLGGRQEPKAADFDLPLFARRTNDDPSK